MCSKGKHITFCLQSPEKTSEVFPQRGRFVLVLKEILRKMSIHSHVTWRVHIKGLLSRLPPLFYTKSTPDTDVTNTSWCELRMFSFKRYSIFRAQCISVRCKTLMFAVRKRIFCILLWTQQQLACPVCHENNNGKNTQTILIRNFTPHLLADCVLALWYEIDASGWCRILTIPCLEYSKASQCSVFQLEILLSF